ncbi:CoA-dependent acyltransferase [Metschnikowia bicuspidata var. bicuspidata NRRL YB-4993]|uniref:CoA-dependent acyltransferase n=1 Tax=Metschnikowia bicuspidata var. bicuspidata NRRL YB-4993 TaxID=869754 RepID=A0A1A0H6J4_9ASCO|nr:CoA-dependent acyltransferase [Metschnikowia bicuspidata var. bicuspidata NRRL YB-4993]OBA19527.1 CoA-dependent acyltransferase [Metschnikowia bicuspidata var. bicuspidata NRRL YB-4993]
MDAHFFASEDNVPKLPVPSLESTLSQVSVALKPLLTAEEYEELLEESALFMQDERITCIQAHLEEAAKNPQVACYLNVINGASYPGIYGDLRGDILPRNPYLILEEDPYAMTINPPNQAQRMASLVNSSLKFIVTMRNGTLKPDVTPKAGKPLTMNCYRNIFGTTRVPAPHHLVTIKKYRELNESRHVVFICNNQFYTLEVLTKCEDALATSKHQLWFSDTELASIVQSIITDASAVDRVASVNNGIGSITTQTYGVWGNARLELSQSSPEALEKIDNALFVAVLDTTISPVTEQEKTRAISFGTSILAEGTNIQVGSCALRWYDKLQLVVTANAVAGVVWESSSMDSTAILRFISDIYTDLILKLARNINGAESTLFDTNIRFVSQAATPQKPTAKVLRFEKTPELSTLVHLSETRLADLLNQHEYRTLNLKLDSTLLSKMNILTDSVLQIGFQIAYYALYGKLANTLEPITTRKFRDARTELIAVQNESVSNLVKLYITSDDNTKKWEAFKACCEIHTALYRDAMKGKGFERHLNALYQALTRPGAIEKLNEVNKDTSLPPISILGQSVSASFPFLFGDMFEKLTNAELLILNCGNPALRLFGIPPSIDQGFGIGYIIQKDSVMVTVSSKYRQTERLLDTFKSFMSEIKRIVSGEADLVMELADSVNRRQELKSIRIQRELSKINLTSSLTKHPIEIILDTPTYEPYQPIKQEEDLPDEDYKYLGGYGYFDMGQVTIRNDQLSHAELSLNSRLHLGSTFGSRNGSKRLSHLNLHAMNKKLNQAIEMRERMSLGEKIRERLLASLNDSATKLAD